jgi:serine/threonine-protein kinase
VKTCGQCQVNYPDAVEYCPVDGTHLPLPPGFVVEEKPERDPLLGTTIDGRYLVESLLGQGGMGFVYAGRHAIIDKRVAIKVLRAEHAQHDQSAAQRFLVEAKAASKIGHQNIVDITDFGMLPDGKTYFVMEFLDGPTLGRLVHEGPLPPLRAIAVSIQIARGLQAAHDKGIIHRDLKPENVFVLEKDGQRDVVKIVDFGIAKDQAHKKRLTQAGMVLGTPEYMSPEQATGQPTDHRVDMYALGCILYEMLTSVVPFKADTPTKTLTEHVFNKVVPPSERRPDLNIPPALEAVVMRALQKKPGDRFADLREMIGALERVDGELRGDAPRRGPAPTLLRRATTRPPSDTMAELAQVRGPIARRQRMILGGGALVVVIGVTVAVVASRPPKPVVATPVVTPAPVAAAAEAPKAPVAPSDVEIVLRTTPAGAEVLEAGKPVGNAPVTLRRPRAELATLFTFRKPGFAEESRAVTPSSDKEIEVVLEPKRDHQVTHKKTEVAGAKIPHTTSPSVKAPAPPPVKQRVSDLRNPFD